MDAYPFDSNEVQLAVDLTNSSRLHPTKVFDKNKCDFCGDCFSLCPTLHLPPEEARTEIEKLLREGESKVLQKCSTCFACDNICPKGCNPCELVLDKWYERYPETGLKVRARYFIPHMFPNFRSYVVDRLPSDEKQLVQSWRDLSRRKEILYPGCNVITCAYLTQTQLLSEYTIRGALEQCCGEMYYRMGLFEQVEQVGKRLEGYFQKMGVKKMIIPCTAGYNMFTNVLPAFDAKFDFEVEHLLPRIWNKIEKGEINFTSKVKKVATIQDSCYGKVLDEDLLELPRRLLEAVGVEVVEMKNSGRASPCCGIGAGFSPSSSFHPFSIQGASAQRLKEAKKTGADMLVVYCAGCLLMFSVAKILYPTRMPVYHLLEILQMAIGEKPLRRQAGRARKLFMGVVRHQFPKLLSWKRFHVEEIQPM